MKCSPPCKDTRRLTWLLNLTDEQLERVKATLIMGVLSRRAIDIAMAPERKKKS